MASTPLRVVGMSECREAALSLAHAFAADEYARYIVDSGGGGDGDVTSAEDRWRLHLDILSYTVASHCMSGLVTAAGPECDSVALWYLSPEAKRRYFREILPLLHDTKAAVLGDRDREAWYLVYLGTKPNSRGRGYASRLLWDMNCAGGRRERADLALRRARWLAMLTMKSLALKSSADLRRSALSMRARLQSRSSEPEPEFESDGGEVCRRQELDRLRDTGSRDHPGRVMRLSDFTA
ncbi:hypothetical protein VTK56DRAFT_2759 [Thermocarpiscus australiensis]